MWWTSAAAAASCSVCCAPRGATARGVDASPAMVELCRARRARRRAGRRAGVSRAPAVTAASAGWPRSRSSSISRRRICMRVPRRRRTTRCGTARRSCSRRSTRPAGWRSSKRYIRDLTHQRPLHPDTLRYLVQASGFTHVDVRFRQPVPGRGPARSSCRNPPDVGGFTPDRPRAQVAAALNAQADKLNARLFSSMDYVVIARRWWRVC